MVRSSLPLSRTTNVPVRPDTVPPILTVTGGGGGGSAPEESPPQPPSAARAPASKVVRRVTKMLNLFIAIPEKTVVVTWNYVLSGRNRTDRDMAGKI
jgi:hypothetical protein